MTDITSADHKRRDPLSSAMSVMPINRQNDARDDLKFTLYTPGKVLRFYDMGSLERLRAEAY
jgi:hypothetical protein